MVSGDGPGDEERHDAEDYLSVCVEYPSVANTVDLMTTSTPASHLTHDELPTAHEMAADCHAIGRHLRLERAARAAVATPPSIHFEDYPAEVGKREIRVSEAAARIANALHLHLD